MGDILRIYEKRHGYDYRDFAKENCVQLNDTHPVFAIPELIRVLKSRGVAYRTAVKIAKDTFHYTNHTLLPEALECWDSRLLAKMLPGIADILTSLNQTQMRRHRREGYSAEEIKETAIYNKRTYCMANTAVFVAGKINGVAEIHSEIIKHALFEAEFLHHSEKFTNVTNGVAQRRWLELANPELSMLIDKRIEDGWRTNFEKLANLNEFLTDKQTLSDFITMKEKRNLSFSNTYKKRKE